MSFAINYPFNTPSNYSYDADKIDVSAGKAGLQFENQQINFQEDFDSDVGFTYDNTKAEFTGGQVQQKDQRSADSLIYANFEVDEDATWARGSVTGTLVGSANINVGSLVLPSGTNNYLQYDATDNMPLGDTGCVRIRYRPQYTGAPGINQYIFASSQGESNIANFVRMMHIGLNIRWDVYDSSGVSIKTVQTGNTFNPTAGQLYEIEFNFDTTNGEYRLFIDGNLVNGLQTSAPGTRNQTAGIIRLGKDYTSAANTVVSCEYEDIIIFDAVQHTANYTPDWSNIPQTIYAESNVTLPEFQHTGVGTIISFDSFTTIESGSPRYTIQIGQSGDYLYWDGAAWDVSDNSYAQANDAATFNANIDQLDVTGEIYGQFRITFPDTNTQAATSQLNALVTETKGYYQNNPTILPNNTFKSDGLLSFTETSIKTGSDEIKHILNKDNIDYYHDGIDWVVSDGTYAQSNTAAEIETNKSTFLTEGDGKTIQVKSFLHSDDGQSTPLLDAIDITYDFAGEDPTLNPITLYGFLRDLKVPLTSRELKVRPAWTYGDKSIITGDWVDADFVTTDTGYWEIDIFIEDVDPTYLEWRIEDRIIKTNFVNQLSVKFSELTILGERDFVC